MGEEECCGSWDGKGDFECLLDSVDQEFMMEAAGYNAHSLSIHHFFTMGKFEVDSDRRFG